MSTLTTTRLDALPRVNLLPPEIAEQRRFRHLQAGLAAAVVASLAGVGALFVMASGQVSSAQDDIAVEQARTTQLQSQVAEYAEVPLVHARVDAAEAQLVQAMGQEIRWSYFLNDLSLKIPNRVWLTNMTATQSVGAAVAAPADGYVAPGIGSVTFTGQAFAHNDVAAWLNSLAKQKGYTQPYFSDSTVAPIGDNTNAVSFSSQVTITDDALSGRFTQKAGS